MTGSFELISVKPKIPECDALVVSKTKAKWLQGYIQGIQIMGEQCDWDRMMGALEKLEQKYNDMIQEAEANSEHHIP